MKQQRAKRFTRQAERFENRQLTQRSLQIASIIAAYRFIPTSLIVRLVPGDKRTTEDHLQVLFHKGHINRFQLIRNGEFIYYIDSPRTIEWLIGEGHLTLEQVDFEAIRTNREKQYAKRDDPGKHLFINHELMITRFHFLVEMASKASEGRVSLASWRQGAALHQSIAVPGVWHNAAKNTWHETDKAVQMPHRPDAMFSVSFPGEPGREEESFFYEADRKTVSKVDRMRMRYRSHFHFVVKMRKHQEIYKVRKIRAVLTETIDGARGERLREEAGHPAVSGQKPSPLFWFTTSEVFLKPVDVLENGKVLKLPRYLVDPGVALSSIWATPVDNKLHSLIEA